MSISILIVNYNNKFYTDICLESLRRQTRRDFEVVVIENGSSRVERASGEGMANFKQVILNKNYGFPMGVNLGVKACTGEWVLVLNNDCEVKEDFVAAAADALASRRNDNEYLVFSPKILQKRGQTSAFAAKLRPTQWKSIPTEKIKHKDKDRGILEENRGVYRKNDIDQKIIYACGDEIDEKGLARNIGRGEIDRGQFDNVKEVPLASFACILVKREILERFPLDETYSPGYYEDVDFCLRLKKAGLKIAFMSQAICWHFGEASFGKLKSIDNEMRQFRNLSFTVAKHFSWFNIVRHWMIFNLKSFRYYFFMKKQWKFLMIETQVLKRLFCRISRIFTSKEY